MLTAKAPCQYYRQDSYGYTDERFNQDVLQSAITSTIIALEVRTGEHKNPAWQRNQLMKPTAGSRTAFRHRKLKVLL